MAAAAVNPFENFFIEVTIPAQGHLTAAQRRAMQKSAPSPMSLQRSCVVAESLNEALGGVYREDRREFAEIVPIEFDNLGEFVLNPRARARFGVNRSGHIFLTVGLKDAEDNRYRLTWTDKAVPKRLAKAAVAHDAGEAHGEAHARLYFSRAKVVENPPSYIELRDQAKARREAGVPTKNQGGPGKPRTHRRICSDDLAKVYAD